MSGLRSRGSGLRSDRSWAVCWSTSAGWRWVFLVNVPFVLLAVPFGLRWLPESRRPGVPPIDIPGVALSTLALGGVVFALIEGVDAGWTSPAVLSPRSRA